MNHEEAIENQVAAGYLLGDLTETERDAFEEHYFDCRECGDTVRAGAAMLAGGREVVENESSFRRFRPLKSALTGAAAAAAIVVATYQTAVIPRLQSLATPAVMEVMRPTEPVSGATRGTEGEEQILRFKGEETLALYREIPDERFPSYEVELRTASGKVVMKDDVSKELTSELLATSLPIPLRVRPLPAGRYALAIRGVREDGNRPELVRYSVVVVE